MVKHDDTYHISARCDVSLKTGQVEAERDVTGVSTVDEQYPRHSIESSKELAQDLRDASGPSADPSTVVEMISMKE